MKVVVEWLERCGNFLFYIDLLNICMYIVKWDFNRKIKSCDYFLKLIMKLFIILVYYKRCKIYKIFYILCIV